VETFWRVTGNHVLDLLTAVTVPPAKSIWKSDAAAAEAAAVVSLTAISQTTQAISYHMA
jgi:hypothetical protein